MPITTTSPGVYVEELPTGVRTIAGVSTSVAAFVDSFSRGPLNEAVQVLNIGDFQSEFGGLLYTSPASYGIHQFFTNGGSNAWVVRTADNAAVAASIELRDTGGRAVLTASAGRRLRGASVADPGAWGNNLRIEVDYKTSDPTSTTLFNLTVSEMSMASGRTEVVRSEQYRNLDMAESASNCVVDVVNEDSKLIQLTLVPSATNRPAATGAIGTSAAGAVSGTLSDGDTFLVQIDGVSEVTAAKLTVGGSPATLTLSEMGRAIQTAIRGVDASNPLLAGAVVEVDDDAFRVLGGRTGSDFDPETILSFVEDDGSTAADIGLLNADANVQQYTMGGASGGVGFQGVGTLGVDGGVLGPDDIIGVRDPDKSGMFALEDVDIFNILCIPAAADLCDPLERFSVYSAAETYCQERRAFLIVDLPADVDDLQTARDWVDANAHLRHPNAAAYFPRPMVRDPLNELRPRALGASGTMAGIYARTDAKHGVWKAPAGPKTALRNVPDLAYKLTDPENGQLNALGLNCLRDFAIHGNVAWGARTLMGADLLASDWKYVPVRRMALFIESSLIDGLQWAVFQPNDEPLWNEMRRATNAFLQGLFRQGAFQGSSPRDAYIVKCDAQTTTPTDVNAGIANLLVGFAPLRPAEFIMINLQLQIRQSV